MASEHVLEFTDQNFETEVLGASGPVMVDFWAEWCTPCLFLGPTVDKIAADYAGQAKVGKINIDANRAVVEKFGISAIPTVIVFKNGEIAQRFVGIKKEEELKRAIDAAK